MLAVDDMYQNLAPIVKDKHWAQRHFSIPYTVSTAAETLKPAFKGSTFDMRWNHFTNMFQCLLLLLHSSLKSQPKCLPVFAGWVQRILRFTSLQTLLERNSIYLLRALWALGLTVLCRGAMVSCEVGASPLWWMSYHTQIIMMLMLPLRATSTPPTTKNKKWH